MHAPNPADDPDAPPVIPFQAAIALEVALVGIAFGLGVAFEHDPAQTLHWSPAGLLWGVLGTLPPLAALWFLRRSRWPPAVEMMRLAGSLLQPLLQGRGVVPLAALALAAGFGEELLFRGLVQGALETPLGLFSAILATSVVFGLLHYLTPLYGLFATLMGAYLGVLWVLTGDLLAPILVHALYDFVALLVLRRSCSAD